MSALPWVVLAVGVFALLADDALVFTRQSARYVRAALALSGGEGFSLWGGEPFARFPPLFVILLAPFAGAGVSVTTAVAAIQATAFAAGAAATAGLARSIGLRAPLLWGVGFCALAPHAALLRGVRPDLLPIAAWPAALWALACHARGGSQRALLTCASIASLAALGRYLAAFTLVPLLLAAVYWSGRQRGRAGRDALLFTAVAALPIAAWIVRNAIVTGHLLGMSRTDERLADRGFGFFEHAVGLVRTLQLDLLSATSLGLGPLLYDGASDPAGLWLAFATAVAAIAVVFALALAFRSEGFAADLVASLRAGTPRAIVGAVCGAHVVGHAAALLALWSVGNNDPIYSRYVAPLYGSLLVGGAILGHSLAERRDALGRRGAMALAVLLAVVALSNLPKTAQLLAPEPADTLVERTTRGGRERWHREIPWKADHFRRSDPSAG